MLKHGKTMVFFHRNQWCHRVPRFRPGQYLNFVIGIEPQAGSKDVAQNFMAKTWETSLMEGHGDFKPCGTRHGLFYFRKLSQTCPFLKGTLLWPMFLLFWIMPRYGIWGCLNMMIFLRFHDEFGNESSVITCSSHTDIPSGYVQIAIEHDHRNSGFSH